MLSAVRSGKTLSCRIGARQCILEPVAPNNHAEAGNQQHNMEEDMHHTDVESRIANLQRVKEQQIAALKRHHSPTVGDP